MKAARREAMLLTCLTVAGALAACSADPTPTPVLAPTAPLQPTATPTAAPASAPTAPPAPTATPERIATLVPTATSVPTSTPTPLPERDDAATPTPEATAPVDDGAQSVSLVMLADPLDEPEFYCVDVAGFGASLGLDRPLQAHTCKPGADDELFVFNRPAEGQLYLVGHDRCIEADGRNVFVRMCSESPLQRFEHRADGTLRVNENGMCLVVAGGVGEPAGGRSHVRRDLLMLSCTEAEPGLSQWVFPGSSPSG